MSSFKVELKGLDQVKKEIREIPKNAEKLIQNELKAFGESTVTMAKQLAPVDEGHLRSSISYRMNGNSVEIVVATDYAAYLEFGTRRFAERYVSQLPADWQAFAKEFKGKGGGTLDEMILRIMAWVKRKGFAANKTKSGSNSKSKDSIQAQENAAYVIAIRILHNGIKAHPFLYPAVEKNKKELIAHLNNLFK